MLTLFFKISAWKSEVNPHFSHLRLFPRCNRRRHRRRSQLGDSFDRRLEVHPRHRLPQPCLFCFLLFLPLLSRLPARWYKRAAELHHVQGMASYADCLLLGMGGECVPALGLIYCAQAAAQSSSHAMLELGKAFARGLYGVPQDAGQAKFWLDKGVSAGQSGTFIDRFEAALKSYSARRLLEELRA
jgi:hypothetical protein